MSNANNTPIYIFGLDGVLATIDNEGKRQPHWPVIGTLLQLYSIGAEIAIWEPSITQDRRDEIVSWIETYLGFSHMRADALLVLQVPSEEGTINAARQTRKWINTMTADERRRMTAYFGVHEPTIATWRKEKITVFQIAE